MATIHYTQQKQVETTIANCPFCQRKTELEMRDWRVGERLQVWKIHCNACRCAGPEAESPERAIVLWQAGAAQLRPPKETLSAAGAVAAQAPERAEPQAPTVTQGLAGGPGKQP